MQRLVKGKELLFVSFEIEIELLGSNIQMASED
jgi:hypothetical protein